MNQKEMSAKGGRAGKGASKRRKDAARSGRGVGLWAWANEHVAKVEVKQQDIGTGEVIGVWYAYGHDGKPMASSHELFDVLADARDNQRTLP